MPRRHDPDSLRRLLVAPGFTPAKGDLDGVVSMLADPDERIAREAERAIARLGEAALPGLAQHAGDERPAVRSGVVRAAGRIAPESELDAAWMIGLLRDADPRVRRHAAIALGKLRRSRAAGAIEAALMQAWDAGPTPDLERAVVASLGMLGGTRARERLAGAKALDAEGARVQRKAELILARDAARQAASAIRADHALGRPARFALLCRSGLEEIVADEARGCPGVVRVEPPIVGHACVYVLYEGELRNLFRIRTNASFAIALPPVATDDEPAEALARAVSSDEAKALLDGWTSGLVRYRIAWSERGHHRARTWRAAELVSQMRPEWVNDPTQSTWEFRAQRTARALYVELHPRGLDDPRFTYRVRDVPAASNPPLAAALVRIARVRPDDVLWDPFVGSAVELVERAIAGPYARLEGTDTDPRALEAARANLAQARVDKARLSRADATTHAPAGVNVIVTNPPMGRRLVRDGRQLASLLERFVDHAADVLPEGGRLAWVSPLGRMTAARAVARGFRVTRDSEVDLGGFRGNLQCFERGPVRPS